MNNDQNPSDRNQHDRNQQHDPADQADQLPAGQQFARRQPASLLRRAAPAAVLGGVAVALVGFLDSGLTSGPPAASESLAAAATASSAPTQEESNTPAADSSSESTTDTQTTAAENCAGSTETVTGAAVSIPWGDVQVAATIANGKVCEVHAVAYPAGDPHSARINSMAIPTIDTAATSAGVAFDNISGATYTSEAYRKSLQSILDQL